MAARAETHELSRIVNFGPALIIRLRDSRGIDQDIRRRWLTGQRMFRHLLTSSAAFDSLTLFIQRRRPRF